MPSKSKQSKVSFREVLVEEIEEYMGKAFDADNPTLREKYREVIREMEQLLLAITELG